MKHWQETQKLFLEIDNLLQQQRKAALATVVAIQGSAYRRPGAKLLIRDDGSLLGNVSGGCLEADLAEIGKMVMSTGETRTVRYETNGPEDELWGLGLGCNGTIELVVRPCQDRTLGDFSRQILLHLAEDQAFSTTTVFANPDHPEEEHWLDAEVVETRSFAVDGRSAFTEGFTPPPRLFIFGAGDDALPLVALAAQTGFRVVVVDHRPALVTAARFPLAHNLVLARSEDGSKVPLGAGDYAVLKTHSLAQDRGWFAHCARARVSYLGLMGPQARRLEVMKDGPEVPETTLFGPVGLDLGADGAEQIAVAIVAEVLAVYHSRSPGHLRDRKKPIH